MADCIFCITSKEVGTPEVGPERILKSYPHWWLVLQLPEKLSSTVQAAGLLITKRHIPGISQATMEEFGELPAIIHDASATLCKAVGSTYTQHTRLGCNEGADAGQTIGHAHVHVLPVSAEDPAPMKQRAGIGGAFEALRTMRMN